MEIHPVHQWKKITPENGIYLFGYYDRNPWNEDQTLHLAMRIPQETRLPKPGETAEIGVIDREGYRPLVTTRTWCHQQGCMELFLPRRPGCFVYNDFDEQEKKPVARIYQLGKGVVDRFEYPIYAISPNGRWGVSLNFGRIPRRGYSYADTPVPTEERHPADLDGEGLRLVDLDNGTSKLIVSYQTMLERHPYGYGMEEFYIWLNHAIFNCDSSRILWLFRQWTDPIGQSCMWHTFMYTCSLTGEDAECILPEVYWKNAISHQIWGRTPREILVDANWRGTGHEAVVFDESRRPFVAQRISKGHGAMSHMVFSPDGKWLLSDSYPDKTGHQKLILIEAATGDMETLGVFRHESTPGSSVDVRCDLHPRWSPDGKLVTVDSVHDGNRAIYRLDLTPVIG